jgi:hypothetical protein
MRPESHLSQLELVMRSDGATLDEARAKAREMCGARKVVREVVVAAGGPCTVKLSAETESELREREERALPAGVVIKGRRLVHPSYEVLLETAASEDEVRSNLRLARPWHRIIAIACRRQPAAGILGMGKHLGEYEVTVIDTHVRSEVIYEARSCVEVVALAAPTDCLDILREPVSADVVDAGRATVEQTRRLAAARCLAEQADPSHGEGILDAIDRFRRDQNTDRHGGRDIYQVLVRGLERIATPQLVHQLLVRWAPPLAEPQSWHEDDHLRAVAALLSRAASSAPGFEALAGCLRSPEARVRAAVKDLIQRLGNVPVPPAARQHMQQYEKQRADEVRASLDANHPGVAQDRFCLDLLAKLAEREMRITGDRDELAGWCRDRGLTRADGETLANVLVSAGLAVGPGPGSLYAITDDGRSLAGASLFAR